MVVRDLTCCAIAARDALLGLPERAVASTRTPGGALEPGTAAPLQRLRAVRTLVDAGIRCGVLMAPLVPGITTKRSLIERTMKAAADHGAASVGAMVLHLEGGTATHFMRVLAARVSAPGRRLRAALHRQVRAVHLHRRGRAHRQPAEGPLRRPISPRRRCRRAKTRGCCRHQVAQHVDSVSSADPLLHHCLSPAARVPSLRSRAGYLALRLGRLRAGRRIERERQPRRVPSRGSPPIRRHPSQKPDPEWHRISGRPPRATRQPRLPLGWGAPRSRSQPLIETPCTRPERTAAKALLQPRVLTRQSV